MNVSMKMITKNPVVFNSYKYLNALFTILFLLQKGQPKVIRIKVKLF